MADYEIIEKDGRTYAIGKGRACERFYTKGDKWQVDDRGIIELIARLSGMSSISTPYWHKDSWYVVEITNKKDEVNMNNGLKYKVGDEITMTGTVIEVDEQDANQMLYMVSFGSDASALWYHRDAVEQPIDCSKDPRYIQDKHGNWWKVYIAGLGEQPVVGMLGYFSGWGKGLIDLINERKYRLGELGGVDNWQYRDNASCCDYPFFAVPVGNHLTEQQRKIRELKETIKQASEQIAELEKEVINE